MARVRRCGPVPGDGGWLRWTEAVRTREVVEILGVYREYRDQRLQRSGAPRLVPGSVIAADELTADWAAILERARPLANYWIMLSPSVNNDEWDLRIALNALSLGARSAGVSRGTRGCALCPGISGPVGPRPGEFSAGSIRDGVGMTRSPRSPRDLPRSKPVCVMCGCRRAKNRPAMAPLDRAPEGPFWTIWEYRSRTDPTRELSGSAVVPRPEGASTNTFLTSGCHSANDESSLRS